MGDDFMLCFQTLFLYTSCYFFKVRKGFRVVTQLLIEMKVKHPVDYVRLANYLLNMGVVIGAKFTI